MSEQRSVLPEFSQLLMKAAQTHADGLARGEVSLEQEQAIVSLIDFVREYDVNIKDGITRR